MILFLSYKKSYGTSKLGQQSDDLLYTTGWNMKVCVVMAVAQLLIWAVWAGITRHPSRWKLWLVVVGGGLAMLLEIYDFPPYEGFLDAHAVWHATTIPLTYIWWSFIRDDAEFLTSNQVKKLAKKAK